MIIGDSDQCLSLEKSAYESSTIILKRKFPCEPGENSTMSSSGIYLNEPTQVPQMSQNAKINYVNANQHQSTDQNGFSYQSKIDEIHQDGQQSYINLTVLAPPPPTSSANHHVTTSTTGQSINHGNNFSSPRHHIHHQQQHDHEIKMPTSIVSNSKTSCNSKSFASQPDNFEDNEDKNLSWLFNFKIDEIANLSPETKRKRSNNSNNSNSNHHQQQQQQQTVASVHQQTYPSTHQQQQTHHLQQQQISYEEQNQKSKDPCIEDDLNVAENVVISNASTFITPAPKKPPFTYTELIEYALEDKGELTVSGIYQWISDRFPYYKSNDDRWKNSVRHNLSINPHFRKGNKAKAGAGHLWKISSRESEANFLAWEHKKQRLELFFKMEAASQQKQQENLRKESLELKSFESICSSSYDDELNAATASIISLPVETSSAIITTHGDRISPNECQQYYQYHEVMPLSQAPTEDLRRTAGEILNGVRRNVEVQIMHPSELQSYSILNTEDYLNPISKEDIMEESGLARRYDEFYLIDSSGVNMTTNGNEEESTEVFEIFHDDFNMNYFGNNNIIA